MADPQVKVVFTADDQVSPKLRLVQDELGKTAFHPAFRQFKSSLAGMALQATGTTGALGKMSEALLLFGAGTGPFLIAAAGIAILGKAYELVTAKSDALKKKTDDLVASLKKEWEAAHPAEMARLALNELDARRKILEVEMATLQVRAVSMGKFGQLGPDRGAMTKLWKEWGDIINALGQAHTDLDKALEPKPMTGQALADFNELTKAAEEATKALTKTAEARFAAVHADLTKQGKTWEGLKPNMGRPMAADFPGASVGTGTQSSPAPVIPEIPSPFTPEFIASLTTVHDQMGEIADITAGAATSAFQQMFIAIGQGQNVFKSLAKAIKQSVAQAMMAEGAQELARAFAALARSFNPITGSGAMAEFAMHMKAAALFTVGGAAIGSIGGGGGGGGGGLSPGTFKNGQSGTNTGTNIFYLPKDALVDTGSRKFQDIITNALGKGLGNRNIVRYT